MSVADLQRQIGRARADGFTPFFVNATAGTTVLGSFDPIDEIADVCARERLWLHVDASWGGGVVFVDELRRDKLKGCGRADSLTVNPHKMLNVQSSKLLLSLKQADKRGQVPITCSFLLGRDVRQFRRSNSVQADYLFHGSDDEEDCQDLADMTLQCGRKADSLKLALGWTYYGSRGYGEMVRRAFERAGQLASLVAQRQDMSLVSSMPPPCLQVCFYAGADELVAAADPAQNSQRTRAVWKGLKDESFSIDYAPGPRGSMLRAVVSLSTQPATLQRLVDAVARVAARLAPRDATPADQGEQKGGIQQR